MMREVDGGSIGGTEECSPKDTDHPEELHRPLGIFVKEEHVSESEEEETVVGCDPLYIKAEPEYSFLEEPVSSHDPLNIKEENQNEEAAEFAEEDSKSSWFLQNHYQKSPVIKEEMGTAVEGLEEDYFFCSTCSQVFTSKSDLTDHVFIHVDSEQQENVCKLCGEVFPTTSCLQEHMPQCPEKHLEETQLGLPSVNLSDRQSVRGRCRKTPSSRGRTKKCRPTKQPIHKKKRFSCEVCSLAFVYQSALKIHMRHHSNQRPFKCDICNGTFKRSDQLRTHTRLHSGYRPYACDVCGKTFTLAGNLTVHARLHTGERPYTCSVCGKTFRQIVCLKRHERVHTGERPYKCDICGKRFTQNSSLKVHLTVHSGERPYVCQICGRSFKRTSHLRDHSRVHAPKKLEEPAAI